MQAHTTSHPADRRQRRRFRDRLLDIFSPTLTCGACGTNTKQYRCEPTGEFRSTDRGEAVTRWTALEIGHRCPTCGATIWVLDVPAQYPVF
jgi:predicted RNA-binding Zn-ribbon protein involved in translation (DUF1610 family)